MDWGGKQGLGDFVADLTGSLALGAAGAVVAFAVSPAWLALGAGGVGGIAASAVGLAVMRRVGRGEAQDLGFEPVAFDACTETDELLLVNRVEDAELLLTDAIGPPDPDARVLRLFEPQTMAVPGELAARIESWLEGAVRRTSGASDGDGRAQTGHGPDSSPASAALHSALADIRRSLR